MDQEIHIGTSGWNYPEWRVVFYPSGLPSSLRLEYYTRFFSTVELNATFYRQPQPSTMTSWSTRTPAGFIWAVKANRFITHVKRLHEVEEPFRRFFLSLEPLRDKLGPILFQLPPGLPFHESSLAEFCRHLRPDFRYVVEVRHRSWVCEPCFKILGENRIAFCISDTAGRYPFYEQITADFTYIRLHGSRVLYSSEYTDDELVRWAQKIASWKRETFVYFDNTAAGHAPANALRLKELLGLTQPP